MFFGGKAELVNENRLTKVQESAQICKDLSRYLSMFEPIYIKINIFLILYDVRCIIKK